MPIIDAFPEPVPALSTASVLNLTFDILPDDLNDLAGQLWLPRLKVDGVEVYIRGRATVNEDENAIGETLNVELLKVSDKALFTPAALIDFGIGRKIAGAWDEATLIPLLTDAVVQSVSHTIEGPPFAPTDRVAVTIVSKTGDRLNKTSETGLIIYDSDRVTINEADLETIYDAQGNAYTPEVIAIPGLKLSHLFSEVFVTRCGFDTYNTNLPVHDYPIQRYDVRMGQRFFDGLKGFIGMYSPAVRPIGDEIWITDTTITQPEGFPAAREITVDKPSNINLSRQPQKLDALMLHFVGLENNYDFTTFKFDYPTDVQGDLRTETEKITVEFRKITGPGTNVIVRDALNIENKRTFLGITEIDSSSDVYEFDASGRQAHRLKTTRKLLPPITDPTLDPILQTALTEKEEYVYQPHPFQRRAEFCARRSFSSEGLILNDSDNPLPNGSDYRRDLITAHRGGMVAAGQTFFTGRIKTRDETAEPQRSGQVRVKVREIDEISRLVTADFTEERPGEIGISGVSSSAQTMPVFAADNAIRSLDRTDDFPIGELPLRYGLPLARRVLIQRQTSSGIISLAHIGYDATLQKGSPIAAADRDGVSLGNFLIVGRSIDISSAGLIMTLNCREIAGEAVVFDDLPSYVRTIDEGEALIFTIPITCTDGYALSVSPSSVSNLSIEARHVEMPEAVWTDLEAGDLDLSPWDGTVEDFQIRVTAGSVSVITRVVFDLIVDVA